MQQNSITEPRAVGNDELTNIFSQVGAKHGYQQVTAKFVALRDFKVKWQRTYRWADFMVSDYVSEAPKEALESLAETIFKKIKGIPADYPEVFCKYVTSEEFLSRNQPTYVRRSKTISKTAKGDFQDLEKAYEGLVAGGFAQKDENIVFSWTKESAFGMTGYSSTLMKAVIISRNLDRKETPDFVLEYAVLEQLLEIRKGLGRFTEGGLTEEEAEKIKASYPKANEAETWIKENCSRF